MFTGPGGDQNREENLASHSEIVVESLIFDASLSPAVISDVDGPPAVGRRPLVVS
jgi:hypothetical protein